MEITREAVEARIEAIKRDLDALIADVHANEGALQEAKHWLTVLDREPEPSPVPETATDEETKEAK